MHYSPKNARLLSRLGFTVFIVSQFASMKGLGLPSVLPPLIYGGGMLLFFCLMLGAFHYQDEIQQNTHKSIIYWGVRIGGALTFSIAMPFVRFAAEKDLALFYANSPRDYMMSGMTLVFLCLLIGILLADIFRRLGWIKS